MMAEVIFVLSSSVFLYTLQQGEGRQWAGVAMAPGHGVLDRLQEAWGEDRQAQNVPGTKRVPCWQHRGDRKW